MSTMAEVPLTLVKYVQATMVVVIFIPIGCLGDPTSTVTADCTMSSTAALLAASLIRLVWASASARERNGPATVLMMTLPALTPFT